LPAQPFVVNDYFQDRRHPHVAQASPMVKDAAERGNGLNTAAIRLRDSFSSSDKFSQRSDGEAAEDTSVYDLPGNTQRERLDRLEAQREPTISRTGPTHYSGGISGPSFLGLGSDPPETTGFVYDNDSPENSEEAYDASYLLDETPRGTSWKAYALLLIIMIFGGLGYLQWKSQIMRPPANDVSSVLNKNGDVIPEGGIPDFAKEKAKQDQERQQKQNNSDSAANANSVGTNAPSADSTAASPAAQNQSAGAGANETVGPEKGTADNATAQTSQAGVNVKSNGPRPQGGVAVSTDGKQSKADNEEGAKPESGETVADVPRQSAATKAQRSAKTNPEEPPQSLGAKDPLLIRAQKFLHGRGVPQDCRAGLNLLRQSAATNSKAQIQMGALYMTGHCVTQDRVSAYKWFSQALAQEPNNQYIERNRASLWANMTPAERNRARQADFY